MKYIHTDKGWLETINETTDFYILKRGGICFKKQVDNTFEIDKEPMDMLIILLKKGVNITNEIAGNDYDKYLELVEQYGDEYVLTKQEFWAIKKLHTQVNFGENIEYEIH